MGAPGRGGRPTLPLPLAAATMDGAVYLAWLVASSASLLPPSVLQTLLPNAFPLGATIMMPALKKPYPTSLVAPVRHFSSWVVCPTPYFAKSIRLLCLR